MKQLLIIWALFFSVVANATNLKLGDNLAAFSLNDQFDNQQSISADTEVLLFSRSMKGGDIIQETLESFKDKQPEKVIYVADISGMPSLIAKFVAIPQFKDMPFVIGLDRDGKATALLPEQKDFATLIRLDGLTIKDIAYFDSALNLQKALSTQ